MRAGIHLWLPDVDFAGYFGIDFETWSCKTNEAFTIRCASGGGGGGCAVSGGEGRQCHGSQSSRPSSAKRRPRWASNALREVDWEQ